MKRRTKIGNDVSCARKEHARDYKDLFDMKKQLLDTLMETQMGAFKNITINDYLAVVDKVLEKKKPMFDEFIESSAKFQRAWKERKRRGKRTACDFEAASELARRQEGLMAAWRATQTIAPPPGFGQLALEDAP